MDFAFENNELPVKGSLLISDPFMADGYFERSVVLLCEHNQEGSFGFVLNNYIEVPFEDIAEQLPPFETKVGIGGPVSKNNLFYIHTLGEQIPGSVNITKDIYAGGDFEVVSKMLNEHTLSPKNIRFFIGYAGWKKDQLENEIKDHAWVVTKVKSSDDIMNITEDSLWEKMMKSLGTKFEQMTKFPQDPKLN